MNRKYFLKDIFNILFFATILLGCLHTIAQTKDTIPDRTEDRWIEKMNDKIAIDVSLNNSYEIFEVKTAANQFILYPNTPTNVRLNLNYRFISFGFQFSPDFIPGNGDEGLKGNTKSFAFGTSLIFKHWFIDLSYSKIKGYYLENSADFIPLGNDDPYIQFPDLNYNGFAFALGYFNNSKFSLRSLTSQTERQLKSAGSFIPAFNFRYYTINDKSPSPTTQRSSNTEASIGPGYAYTFVVKEKFYLSLGVLANVGYLNTRLTTRQPTGDIVTNQDNFIFRWDGKTGIGYNGSRFYTGIYANVSGTRYRQESTTVINHDTRIFYHLFFGIRIKFPDYLDRHITKLENKFLKK